MIKLYSNLLGTSPYSRKGLIILEEKNLPYEKINIDPEFLPDGFGELNPNLRATLLIDGDRIVFESDIIVDYLLRSYPGPDSESTNQPPLLPEVTRPEEHTDDSKMLLAIETVIDSTISIAAFHYSNVDPADIKPWGWIWKRDQKRLHSCLKWIDQRATSEGFVPGYFSFMDIKMMCAIRAITRCSQDDWEQYKNIRDLYGYFEKRPSIVATDPGPMESWE